MKRVLLVCLGNICRSPLAEAVLRDELARAGLGEAIEVDSAGTGDWHVGQPPDPRSVAAARNHGLELTGTARQVSQSDFHDFDLILALDSENLADLRALRPAGSPAEIRLFGDYDVPDPYYGGDDGFEEVYRIVSAAAKVVLAQLSREP